MFFSEDRKKWLLSVLGLILAFVLLNLDLVSMRSLFKWDAWYLFWPMFYALVSSLEAGHLPLWDPRPCCGFPFHADPQTGTFYPVFWLTGLVFGGGSQVYQYLWLAHWLFGMVGFLFLVKRLGLSPAAGFAGSVTYGFSGFFVGQASQTVCVFTMAYVPWVLLLIDKAARESFYYTLPAGVLFGFTGLGGHPGMTIYAALMTCVWSVLKYGRWNTGDAYASGLSRHSEDSRILISGRSHSQLSSNSDRDGSMRRILGILKYLLSGRIMAILLCLFLIGSLVLAPAYVAFFSEGRDYTDRVGSLSVREACHLNRFPFDALVSLVVPGVSVAYPALFETTPDRVAMLNGYFGIFGLLALVVTILDKGMRKQWAWLLIFMLIAFLVSLGSGGGLKVIGHYILPPLSFVRHPSFARVFWMLGGAILAAALLDRLLFCSQEDRASMVSLGLKILTAMLYVALTVLLWAWLATEQAVNTEPSFSSIAALPNSFSLAFNSTVFSVGMICLFIIGLLLSKTTLTSRAVTAVLIALVVLDAAAHLHTNRYTLCWNGQACKVTRGFEDKGAAKKDHGLDEVEPRVTKPATFNAWAFDGRQYIRAYIAPKSGKYDVLVGSSWVPCKDTKFLQVLEKCPRFWLTPSVSFCRDDDVSALSILVDKDGTGPVPVYVHEGQAGAQPRLPGSVKPGTYGKVGVAKYKPQEVVLLVDSPADAWLFAAERYSTGWSASVDGMDASLTKANFCFRAVAVPKGSHVVTMKYAPWVHMPLLVLSWGLSLVVLVGWLVAGVRTRKLPQV